MLAWPDARRVEDITLSGFCRLYRAAGSLVLGQAELSRGFNDRLCSLRDRSLSPGDRRVRVILLPLTLRFVVQFNSVIIYCPSVTRIVINVHKDREGVIIRLGTSLTPHVDIEDAVTLCCQGRLGLLPRT